MEQTNAINANPDPQVASAAEGATVVDIAPAASEGQQGEQTVASAAPAAAPAPAGIAPVESLQPGAQVVVDMGTGFPAWVLNTGFLVGLALASACLVTGGYYLSRFQAVTQDSVLKVLEGKTYEPGLYKIAMGAQLYLARVQLVSCGIYIAMAFGFLGFALFLLGAKGQIDAEGSNGAALKLKVLNLAPGAFVLLCASILVGVCVTRPLPFGYHSKRPATAAQSSQTSQAQEDEDFPEDPLDVPSGTASTSADKTGTSTTTTGTAPDTVKTKPKKN